MTNPDGGLGVEIKIIDGKPNIFQGGNVTNDPAFNKDNFLQWLGPFESKEQLKKELKSINLV